MVRTVPQGKYMFLCFLLFPWSCESAWTESEPYSGHLRGRSLFGITAPSHQLTELLQYTLPCFREIHCHGMQSSKFYIQWVLISRSTKTSGILNSIGIIIGSCLSSDTFCLEKTQVCIGNHAELIVLHILHKELDHIFDCNMTFDFRSSGQLLQDNRRYVPAW